MAFQLMSLFVWGNQTVFSEKALKITKIKQIRDCVTEVAIAIFKYFSPINSIKIKISDCYA